MALQQSPCSVTGASLPYYYPRRFDSFIPLSVNNKTVHFPLYCTVPLSPADQGLCSSDHCMQIDFTYPVGVLHYNRISDVDTSKMVVLMYPYPCASNPKIHVSCHRVTLTYDTMHERKQSVDIQQPSTPGVVLTVRDWCEVVRLYMVYERKTYNLTFDRGPCDRWHGNEQAILVPSSTGNRPAFTTDGYHIEHTSCIKGNNSARSLIYSNADTPLLVATINSIPRRSPFLQDARWDCNRLYLYSSSCSDGPSVRTAYHMSVGGKSYSYHMIWAPNYLLCGRVSSKHNLHEISAASNVHNDFNPPVHVPVRITGSVAYGYDYASLDIQYVMNGDVLSTYGDGNYRIVDDNNVTTLCHRLCSITLPVGRSCYGIGNSIHACFTNSAIRCNIKLHDSLWLYSSHFICTHYETFRIIYIVYTVLCITWFLYYILRFFYRKYYLKDPYLNRLPFVSGKPFIGGIRTKLGILTTLFPTAMGARQHYEQFDTLSYFAFGMYFVAILFATRLIPRRRHKVLFMVITMLPMAAARPIDTAIHVAVSVFRLVYMVAVFAVALLLVILILRMMRFAATTTPTVIKLCFIIGGGLCLTTKDYTEKDGKIIATNFRWSDTVPLKVTHDSLRFFVEHEVPGVVARRTPVFVDVISTQLITRQTISGYTAKLKLHASSEYACPCGTCDPMHCDQSFKQRFFGGAVGKTKCVRNLADSECAWGFAHCFSCQKPDARTIATFSHLADEKDPSTYATLVTILYENVEATVRIRIGDHETHTFKVTGKAQVVSQNATFKISAVSNVPSPTTNKVVLHDKHVYQYDYDVGGRTGKLGDSTFRNFDNFSDLQWPDDMVTIGNVLSSGYNIKVGSNGFESFLSDKYKAPLNSLKPQGFSFKTTGKRNDHVEVYGGGVGTVNIDMKTSGVPIDFYEKQPKITDMTCSTGIVGNYGTSKTSTLVVGLKSDRDYTCDIVSALSTVEHEIAVKHGTNKLHIEVFPETVEDNVDVSICGSTIRCHVLAHYPPSINNEKYTYKHGKATQKTSGFWDGIGNIFSKPWSAFISVLISVALAALVIYIITLLTKCFMARLKRKIE